MKASASALTTGPGALLRSRFRAWAQRRQPPDDTLLLTQRNVYILPTQAGFMFAITVAVLLLASINYQLNLGYVLTFLLAGSGIVSMHLTHATLRGLTLHLKPPAPSFAGDPARLELVLTSPGKARFGIGLKAAAAADATLVWLDVPAGSQAHATVSFVCAQRGRHATPALSAETRFPLGLFRSWTVWRPAATLLVYPRPERPAPPLPGVRPVPRGPNAAPPPVRVGESGELDGVRGYRRGDALKQVAWKISAKALEAGGDFVSRDTSTATHRELWLDWHACGGMNPEDRLSRLTAWTLAAHQAGVDHGLRLPGVALAPERGEAQRRRCLEALALWA